MSFEIDTQTIQDLGLFDENPQRQTIFSYFNKTKTFGGRVALKRMMQNPLAELNALKKRQNIIMFLRDHPFSPRINSGQMDFIDHYFRLNKSPLRSNAFDSFFSKYWVRQYERNDLYLIQAGVENLVFLIQEVEKWVNQASIEGSDPSLRSIFSCFQDYLRLPEIKMMLQKIKEKPKSLRAHLYDRMFRVKYRKETEELIASVYLVDAYRAVAETASLNKLGFPEYVDSATPQIEMKGLFHPLLRDPVPNDWALTGSKSLCFLTGPNMVGKSTFLKSLGVSVYLAHLGFPVPARFMKTTVYNGLVTTINLADHMDRGYSHFYSEVNRIKEVAQMINSRKRMFVIFDELFRGTNVKDAYDASLLIIDAFAQIKQCSFCISTHITEVAEKLLFHDRVLFKLFDVNIVNSVPFYTYKLQDGVSHERLGMLIVKNEKIIELLAASQGKPPE
jgi:DNA mismatch repair protein MutS